MRKRKVKTRRSYHQVALLILAVTGNVMAVPAMQTATQIPVTADAQVRVAVSNTDPNMLVVPGDRIVAIDSAQGMFLNGDNKGMTGQANGGVVLMTAQTKPFTFYVRTAGGLTVSIVAVPQKRDGRVLQLISDKPVSQAKAQQWERSQPYVNTLVDIQKALLNGALPEGFVKAPVTGVPAFRLPPQLSWRANQMWSGGALRVYQLTVRNNSAAIVNLPERLFQAEGVRAVMVFPWGGTLLPSGQSLVLVTVSDTGEAANGEH